MADFEILPKNIESNFLPIDEASPQANPTSGDIKLEGNVVTTGVNSSAPQQVFNIQKLSEITGDLGDIVAGTITMPASGFIRAGQTLYNTGSGFYLGNDMGTPKFSIGDGDTNYLTWNGTTLQVSGVQYKTTISSDCSAKVRFGQTVTGTGAITDTSGGLNLDAGSGGGTASASAIFSNETGNKSDFFTGNPTFSCFVKTQNGFTANAGSTFFGIGQVTVASTGHTYTTSHIGFKFLKVAGTTTLYATQGDGSTENASSALATSTATGDIFELVAVVNGTTSVDYYWRKNGGALSSATRLTSNLPTANTGYFQFSISNDNAAGTYEVRIGSFTYSRSS